MYRHYQIVNVGYHQNNDSIIVRYSLNQSSNIANVCRQNINTPRWLPYSRVEESFQHTLHLFPDLPVAQIKNLIKITCQKERERYRCVRSSIHAWTRCQAYKSILKEVRDNPVRYQYLFAWKPQPVRHKVISILRPCSYCFGSKIKTRCS